MLVSVSRRDESWLLLVYCMGWLGVLVCIDSTGAVLWCRQLCISSLSLSFQSCGNEREISDWFMARLRDQTEIIDDTHSWKWWHIIFQGVGIMIPMLNLKPIRIPKIRKRKNNRLSALNKIFSSFPQARSLTHVCIPTFLNLQQLLLLFHLGSQQLSSASFTSPHSSNYILD